MRTFRYEMCGGKLITTTKSQARNPSGEWRKSVRRMQWRRPQAREPRHPAPPRATVLEKQGQDAISWVADSSTVSPSTGHSPNVRTQGTRMNVRTAVAAVTQTGRRCLTCGWLAYTPLYANHVDTPAARRQRAAA
jgi:hypothetical protein